MADSSRTRSSSQFQGSGDPSYRYETPPGFLELLLDAIQGFPRGNIPRPAPNVPGYVPPPIEARSLHDYPAFRQHGRSPNLIDDRRIPLNIKVQMFREWLRQNPDLAETVYDPYWRRQLGLPEPKIE